jgi:ubiquinone/menaquinone biosynthesis C-methylase UbiE
MSEIITKQNEWWEKNIRERYNEFVSWLGDPLATTRLFMKEFCLNNGVKSLLDTACGPCIDYEVLRDTNIHYSGIDSTSVLVEMALLRGINVKQANIEALPFEDNSFDIVYGRHILEHLEYYEKAITEAIRVTNHYVMYTFFLEHRSQDITRIDPQLGTFANSYDLNKMQEFIKSLNCVPVMIYRPDFYNQSILIIEK